VSKSRGSNEEVRKLQITGGSTYIISLPKKWVVQNHLGKNSSLRISVEDNGTLSVSPSEFIQKGTPQEAYLLACPEDTPDALIRKTVSSYLVGYNLIHIIPKNQSQLASNQRNSLKTFARTLLVGTEIVTDTPTELTLQVLLSYPELSVQNALRRMCIITASMHKDALACLEKLDYELAQDIINTDNEVDRFTLYIVRQLKMAIQNPRIIKEIGLANARDCLGYRLVAKSVERTADHAVNIAENVLAIKKPLSAGNFDKIKRMSDLAVSMFETAVDALFRNDFDLAESVFKKAKKVVDIEKEVLSSIHKTEIQEIANLRLIIESIRRTAEYSTDIAEIVLNLTVESAITTQ